MRIVVASPPKSGNHWIKCLLAAIYRLAVLEDERKERITAESLPGWLTEHFPEDSIIHIHNRCTTPLCDVIDAIPAHLVTIVRDPYDVFVSMYYWEQERSARGLGRDQPRPRNAMYGKPLDHEDVVRFLADGFGPQIAKAIGWLHSGRALPIRYEELHDDPVAALTRVTNQIEPVPVERIAAALETCRAERVRQQDEKMAWHVRTARVGDSRDKLSDVHLDVFRSRHAELIRTLGYEVR
jgi:hypothetical protein